MGLFGGMPKKPDGLAGLLGLPMTGGAPFSGPHDYSMNLQLPQGRQAQVNQMASMPVQQRPQREAGTGIGASILGAIGDALLQKNGGQPIYATGMMQRQKQQMLAQQAEAQRAAEWEDWQRKFDYERANPKPANNDTIADYNFIAQQIGPEAAQQYLRNMGDPMVNIPLSDGRFYSGPRSGMGAAMGQMQSPTKPVGKLTPIGGPSQPATGGFR